jgi:hypothetical protein
MAALHLSEGHCANYSAGKKQGGNAPTFDPIATQTVRQKPAFVHRAGLEMAAKKHPAWSIT